MYPSSIASLPQSATLSPTALLHFFTTLRPANRRTQEYSGPCPYCGGDPQHSDRFRVWLEPGQEHFWCRQCNEKGPLSKLIGDARPTLSQLAPRTTRPRSAAPAAAQQAAYRALYSHVALWASLNLHDDANPDPLAYLRQRGLSDATISRSLLGYTLRDPTSLPAYLRQVAPDLLLHAEAAGLLIPSYDGQLRAHPTLCGTLLLPYLAEGEVVDLRTRSFPGKGYRSLAGSYSERGAVFPFGWDSLDGATTIILTEGEIKALATIQAYHDGRLDAPALAHPGLSYLHDTWPALFRDAGVQTVILAYDNQIRPVKDGMPALAPEEIWSLRHGQTLEAAGLEVQVLRLPLGAGEEKADLDAFLLAHGPQRLQHAIDTAPDLRTYWRSLPHGLLDQAKLPVPPAYPLRRARPLRMDEVTPAAPHADVAPAQPLDAVRDQIADLARDHAATGTGFLVLAHPPGTGKGHNTAQGLRAYLQEHPTPGQIIWTAQRKEQMRDQTGLPLILLHGRSAANCRMLPEAQALQGNSYSVRLTLCEHRCTYHDHCTYLRQFKQEGDLFAAQPLLLATNWWKQARIVVLDEFSPSHLVTIITLNSVDLGAMSRASTCPYTQTLLRWLAQLLASSLDRTLTGALLLSALAACAQAEGYDLTTTLHAACASLPDLETQARLPGLPRGATVADYAALPPNHLITLLPRLAHEWRRHCTGTQGTSRLEMRGGRLQLFLRHEHLITQLACADQPKLILDATVNVNLLQALFPQTPIQIVQPPIAGRATVVQVITRDWAKITLRGPRRDQWYAEVAQQIRPGRNTLVVCTMACEADLRAALKRLGHGAEVVVAHYGALRGSNAYKGYDVILAQVYHPNLDALVREGRALFADDATPLNERMITTTRTLTDASGASWAVPVPTFADPRLAALLQTRRESEMEQCAMRGRPFDHPDSQITVLCGLPLPGLPPTQIVEAAATPQSNAGRQAAARAALADAAQALLTDGTRVLSVEALAQATGQSVVTVRKHLAAIAGRLRLRLVRQRRRVRLTHGGQRDYERTVLVQRGRAAPTSRAAPLPDPAPTAGADQGAPASTPPARAPACPPLLRRPRRILARPPQLRRRLRH